MAIPSLYIVPFLYFTNRNQKSILHSTLKLRTIIMLPFGTTNSFITTLCNIHFDFNDIMCTFAPELITISINF